MTKEISETQKWMVSFWSGLLFLLIASPFMYKLTGSLFSMLNINIESDGCPNYVGLIIHALVFVLLVRLMMYIPMPGKS